MTIAGNRNGEAAIGDLAIGEDRAVLADDDAGAVLDSFARRRTADLRSGRKRVERARHRDHHRLDGVFQSLVVQDGKDAYLVALEHAAQIKLLQALQARQHEEIRLDHGIVDIASGGLFLLAFGELCRGGVGLLAARQHHLNGAGRRTPFGAIGVARLLRHQFYRDTEPHTGAGIGRDPPTDIVLPPPRGLGQHAAFLRIEHAGRLAAVRLLKFLDGAVILPDPGEVRLQRQPFRLRHRARGIGGALESRRADRNGRDRLRLAAGRGGRRRLRTRGCPQNQGHEYQCCGQHRSHDKSQGVLRSR